MVSKWPTTSMVSLNPFYILSIFNTPSILSKNKDPLAFWILLIYNFHQYQPTQVVRIMGIIVQQHLKGSFPFSCKVTMKPKFLVYIGNDFIFKVRSSLEKEKASYF